MLSYRVVTMQAKGLVPNYEASMTKLFASELSQRIARTAMKVTGLYGQLLRGQRARRGQRPLRQHVHADLASTIAGGTSEIQRNIIATARTRPAARLNRHSEQRTTREEETAWIS